MTEIMPEIKQKLKTVHITNYFHKNSGGISTVYNRLLEEANRHERFARLIVPGEQNNVENVGKFGKIYYVKAAKSPIFDHRYRLIMPWQYLPESSLIRRILEQEKPDVIEIAEKYTLSYLAGWIKKGGIKTLNRPMLVHLSCERMDDNLRAHISVTKPIRLLAKTVMGNYVAPMFDYHFANSQYTADELLSAVENGKNPKSNIFWRYFNATKNDFPETVFVNNCGVDNGMFNVGRKNAETRRKISDDFGISKDATILLYAGRISPEKNVELLYQMMRSLVGLYNSNSVKRDYQLLIAGDGPQKDWLENQIQNHAPGHFKFLGHIKDKNDLANLYANADIFIHPNPREPFGIAPLEAMASGTPVIVPDSGGVLSYANDENAWIAKPEFEGYVAAVGDVFNNDERRGQKVKKALETAQNFTWEKSFERCFALYDELHEQFINRNNMPKIEVVPAEVGFAAVANKNHQ